MPSVCGSVNSAPKPRSASAIEPGRAAAWAGSCTSRQISSQASTPSPASTQKPVRQELACTSQASGVPVNSMPTPPSAITRPETAAKRTGGKWRAMNTVQTRKAGAQPMPISTCPSTSTPKLPARADSAEPAMATGKATSTVRRTPCRSMPMPMNSCMAPKAKWNAPANRPSAWADSANSPCSGAARMAAMVR
jgi:hypothetical protein